MAKINQNYNFLHHKTFAVTFVNSKKTRINHFGIKYTKIQRWFAVRMYYFYVLERLSILYIIIHILYAYADYSMLCHGTKQKLDITSINLSHTNTITRKLRDAIRSAATT